MKVLQIKSDSKVNDVFKRYPQSVQAEMLELRHLIFQTARELEDVTVLEENLKWGEPSYIAEHGSTLRIDWNPKSPQQYAMYFQCTSRLVETFKALFSDTFTFEGNRAILFPLGKPIPKKELQSCIGATLTYHKAKHLPTLGL